MKLFHTTALLRDADQLHHLRYIYKQLMIVDYPDHYNEFLRADHNDADQLIFVASFNENLLSMFFELETTIVDSFNGKIYDIDYHNFSSIDNMDIQFTNLYYMQNEIIKNDYNDFIADDVNESLYNNDDILYDGDYDDLSREQYYATEYNVFSYCLFDDHCLIFSNNKQSLTKFSVNNCLMPYNETINNIRKI